jgi:hypothetical protein
MLSRRVHGVLDRHVGPSDYSACVSAAITESLVANARRERPVTFKRRVRLEPLKVRFAALGGLATLTALAVAGQVGGHAGRSLGTVHRLPGQ